MEVTEVPDESWSDRRYIVYLEKKLAAQKEHYENHLERYALRQEESVANRRGVRGVVRDLSDENVRLHTQVKELKQQVTTQGILVKELEEKEGYLERVREGLEDDIAGLEGVNGDGGKIADLNLKHDVTTKLMLKRIEELEEREKVYQATNEECLELRDWKDAYERELGYPARWRHRGIGGGTGDGKPTY